MSSNNSSDGGPDKFTRTDDLVFALWLARHAIYPCSDGHGHDIGDFYRREARDAADRIKDEDSAALLRRLADYPL